MRKVEYTVKVVTTTTVDQKGLQDEIAGLNDFNIESVEVTNFRVLPVKKAAKVAG